MSFRSFVAENHLSKWVPSIRWTREWSLNVCKRKLSPSFRHFARDFPRLIDCSWQKTSFPPSVMNYIKRFINWFLLLPTKKKGIVLIILSLFLFLFSLVIVSDQWDSDDSLLTNLGSLDLRLVELNATFPNDDYYLVNIPMRFIGCLSLTVFTIGGALFFLNREQK